MENNELVTLVVLMSPTFFFFFFFFFFFAILTVGRSDGLGLVVQAPIPDFLRKQINE